MQKSKSIPFFVRWSDRWRQFATGINRASQHALNQGLVVLPQERGTSVLVPLRVREQQPKRVATRQK